MMVTRVQVVAKLDPARVKTSSRFTALLAYLLEEHWTSPELDGLKVTSDGSVLNGDGNTFLGRVEDLERNLRGVAKSGGLTAAETRWLLGQVAVRASDERRVDL
jgi:hypothetical protein